MIFGLFAAQENGRRPEGRYYSFEDTKYSGYATFMEIDRDMVERLGRAYSKISGCHRVEQKLDKFVQCRTTKNQMLVYDLDRAFVAAVAPAASQLLNSVEAMMFEVDVSVPSP